MKKLLVIPFALLILISGMHISIATHICKGEVASIKWSFTGQVASCGMETSEQTCPIHKTLDSNCCQNQVDVYSTDTNYDNYSFQSKEINKNILTVPVKILLNSLFSTASIHINVSPPDIAFSNAVNLSDICIFRI